MMKRFARIFLFTVLIALVALGFTGCVPMGEISGEPDATMPPMTAELFTDYDAVYAYYNEVTFADTLATLTERFGEPVPEETENGTNYAWHFEDGYGFVCAFFETGELRAKVIYYDDIRQFRNLSNATNLSAVQNFDKNIDFQTCVSVFAGRPIEIAQISTESTGKDIRRVYAWIDADDNIVQILFTSQGKVESASYNIDK